MAESAELQYEVVTKLSAKTPPGNIAVSPSGRIFISIHEFYNKRLRLAEVHPDGSVKPYPTKEWAFAAQQQDSGGLYGVLGLNVDQHGILWMLDVSSDNAAGRLVAWNTNTETLHRVIYLAEPVINAKSFLNDLSIDTKNNAVYIADTGQGAVIVVDLDTGLARRVLHSAKQTKAEDLLMVIDSKTVELGGAPARLGINPITIDNNFDYLYFGAMTGQSLYRIRTKDLLNQNLSEKELVKKVERYGSKPISDGITIDSVGNVYVTSITDSAIGVTTPDGKYKSLFQSEELPWPDGLAVGQDSFIYATVNELHRSPMLNNGRDKSKGNFKIIRFKALAPASIGR